MAMNDKPDALATARQKRADQLAKESEQRRQRQAKKRLERERTQAWEALCRESSSPGCPAESILALAELFRPHDDKVNALRVLNRRLVAWFAEVGDDPARYRMPITTWRPDGPSTPASVIFEVVYGMIVSSTTLLDAIEGNERSAVFDDHWIEPDHWVQLDRELRHGDDLPDDPQPIGERVADAAEANHTTSLVAQREPPIEPPSAIETEDEKQGSTKSSCGGRPRKHELGTPTTDEIIRKHYQKSKISRHIDYLTVLDGEHEAPIEGLYRTPPDSDQQKLINEIINYLINSETPEVDRKGYMQRLMNRSKHRRKS